MKQPKYQWGQQLWGIEYEEVYKTCECCRQEVLAKTVYSPVYRGEVELVEKRITGIGWQYLMNKMIPEYCGYESEDRLFATFEEAQDECTKRNKENSND